MTRDELIEKLKELPNVPVTIPSAACLWEVMEVYLDENRDEIVIS